VHPSDASTPPAPRAEALRRNRFTRFGFFFLGLAIFYAPFALLGRLVGWIFPASMPGTWVPDVHTNCMRMPVGWLAQPWMWGWMGNNPLYFTPIILLPIAAVAAGPLFCGWLCPAGSFPEFLGRIVPDRFKWDFKGMVEITSVRYGFLVGFLIVPFVAASVCCSFCNFTWMQNTVSALFGNVAPWLYISTTGVLTIVIWIFLLGMFTKGGRGWCLFLCPAGSLMSLASGVTSRFKWLPRVRHDATSCASCSNCEDVCPVRAIDVSKPHESPGAAPMPQVKVNQLLCNVCLDCVRGCPRGCLRYGRAQ